MRTSIITCDNCKKEQPIVCNGWIQFGVSGTPADILIFQYNADENPDTFQYSLRTKVIPHGMDFCSKKCFLKYVKSKVDQL